MSIASKNRKRKERRRSKSTEVLIFNLQRMTMKLAELELKLIERGEKIAKLHAVIDEILHARMAAYIVEEPGTHSILASFKYTSPDTTLALRHFARAIHRIDPIDEPPSTVDIKRFAVGVWKAVSQYEMQYQMHGLQQFIDQMVCDLAEHLARHIFTALTNHALIKRNLP